MNSDEVLVMAFALPPMWLAAKLWWSARHAVDELRAYGARVPIGEQAGPDRQRSTPGSGWG